MPPAVYDVFGLLAAGLVLGRLVLENIKGAGWQVLVPMILGLFGLLIAVTVFATPGSAGAFAFGIAAAYFWSTLPSKPEPYEREPR